MGGLVAGLAHIGVRVADMERSLAFYRGALGFTVTADVRRGEGERYVFLGGGDCRIELILEPGGAAADGRIEHIALRVRNMEEARAALAGKADVSQPMLVEELGLRIKVAFFRGPDGEGLELVEEL